MNWCDDMSKAPLDRSVIWCYFPLEGLDPLWERVKAVFWNPETKLWTWENRAYRSYSRGYDPTHWMEKTNDEKPWPPTYQT